MDGAGAAVAGAGGSGADFLTALTVRFLALILAAGALAACGARDGSGVVEVGKPMPPYAAVTPGGDSVTLASRRGKVVMLNVWATWCHPCRAEIPELVALNKRYASRGLEIVGVSVDAAAADADVRAFMKDFAMDYSIWLDPEDRISTQFLLVGVPTTFVIDRDGILRWRKTGPVHMRDTTLTGILERALGS
jgi:cytochrome c biogenesis protein CcmG/thiol:disulfide interchange protein DsbE